MRTKGTARLREQNEKLALAFLRVHKTGTRQQLAKALDVSRNTVSLIADDFIQRGMIREIKTTSGGVGRPHMLLALKPDFAQSIGVSLAASRCESVVTDYVGNILAQESISVETVNAQVAIDQLTAHCLSLLNRYPNALGIGVAVPGLVDTSGNLHYSAHLQWNHVALADRLHDALSVPIKVLNRVHAAALSPHKVIPEEAASTFYIRVDTGVGGALIHQNEIFHGSSWTSGEVGHLTIKPEGPICGCGKQGCLEALISLPAMTKRLLPLDTALRPGDDFNLRRFLKSEGSRRPEVNTIMTEAGEYLGAAIAAVVNLVNPEFIVVDSPYRAFESFREGALREAGKQALGFPFSRTNVLFIETDFSSSLGVAKAVVLDYENF